MNSAPTPPPRPSGPAGGGRAFGVAFGTDRAKNFKATLKKLASYLRPYWARLTVVVVFAIISTIFMIIGPKLLGDMTNDIVQGYVAQQTYEHVVGSLPKGVSLPRGTTGADILARMPTSELAKIPTSSRASIDKIDFSAGRPSFNWSDLRRLGLLLLGLYLVSAAFNYAQSWLMADTVQRLTYGLRRDIASKINKLPLRYFDSHPYGEVLSRVTNDIDTVGQNLNQSVTQIISSIVMVVGVIIAMLTISWQLTLIALVTIPISVGGSIFIVKRSQRYFKGQQDTLGLVNSHVEEMFSGHQVMRAYNGEQRSISTFKRHNRKLYQNAWRAQFLSGLLMPITQFVGNLGLVGVVVGGAWLAVNGKVNIGDIQAFLQYINQLNQPVMQAANVSNVLQLAAAAAERVFDFLAETEEAPDPADARELTHVAGEVTFDHVKFGYDPEQTIIKDFTAQIKPGQRIAIVGPTGAGKTTMVNLLMRFYDVDSGAIKIDDTNTQTLKRADVRKLFGMVLQDTWLFNGTIAENIAYGRAGATKEEIVEAAKAAHADGFIRALPGSYDMVLNEEADNVAAGEKQLLTIARAMLADPPMLILDEATSSVDTRTEVLIQHAMDKLMKNRTAFIIAHRLSTIRDADLILVMKAGNIVEHGTHTELLKQKGFYANLYNSQFAGAID
jgi:ATP-binding cassette subfamily B multidrug efflux pump